MAGYKDLLVYTLSVTIYDFTVIFCNKFLFDFRHRRLVEQMIHAARSGKQNIVEGSLEKSMESNIKLTGVARASFGELLEDYKDYLRQKNLTQWEKNDSKVMRIRLFKESTTHPTNLTDLSNWTKISFENSENFSNLMICLIYKESYLLDQLLKAQEHIFITQGGFREQLFKKRMEYRKTQKEPV